MEEANELSNIKIAYAFFYSPKTAPVQTNSRKISANNVSDRPNYALPSAILVDTRKL
jgi:hypothetical protein